MADVTLYHNPNCSTSKAALEVLRRAGVDHEVVLYLKQPPSRETLEHLIEILEDDPADLVRQDSFFKDQVLGTGFDPSTLSDPAVVVDLLMEHPRLLQRPVVVKGGRAVIGRPKDRVPALLEAD
jgi:arsenate reductase